MAKYGLFLGCIIPARMNAYDLSARKVLRALGLELVDLGTCCCGSPYMFSISRRAALSIAAWNLAIAEEAGVKTLVTLCNGCNEVLNKAAASLEDLDEREEVNALLAKLDRAYKGEVVVKHIARVIYEDVGLDKVRGVISRPLEGLSVAVHYGCHLLRPSNIVRFDDPHEPRSIDELVEAAGARSVSYMDKLECCGLPVVPVDEALAYYMANDKIMNVEASGADVLVTACPSCFIHLENALIRMGKRRGGIAVMHFTQLLGLAMGMGYDELGLDENRTDVGRVLRLLGARSL